MLGKPEWFGPRRFGWGLGVKRWQGIAYIILIAFLYGIIFASPLGNDWKVGIAIVLSALVIIDLLHIMGKVYSGLDEREERHQLLAERNASFTAIAIVFLYMMYQSLSAGLESNIMDFQSMALPAIILVSMALAKGGTLLLIEREG